MSIFTLPDLHYDYDALEPYIDDETMRLHHDKHHVAYVKNLNHVFLRSLLRGYLESSLPSFAKASGGKKSLDGRSAGMTIYMLLNNL